ncbi:MAG: sugar phosphate isomerase [Chloroflexota bacterium]
MNPIGANTWIWFSPLTDERLATLAPRIRGWGFDVIELPIEQLGGWDPDRARLLLDDLGLGVTTCAVMPATRDLLANDPAVVAATAGYLRGCIDVAATVGAGVVAGPIYSSVGRTWRLDDAERRETIDRLIATLRPLAEAGAARGITLAIEPLNRFETSLINTVEQALEVVEGVNSPGLGIALDTFHMNIEEKDLASAIRRAGPRLAHVQASGSDRGAPGNDHLDWRSIAAALADVGYAGPICIESFTPENETIAKAAAIWRPLERSQDAIATDGIDFLRRLLADVPSDTRPPRSLASGGTR